MPKSRLLLAVIIASLLAGLYFLPRLPPVRGFVLSRLEAAVAGAGYQLDFVDSGGNLWTSLTLLSAQVRGPGLDASAETLGVRYDLFGLLTGQLPVSVRALGVRGQLAVNQLELPSGGEGGGVRLALREVDLHDVEVDVLDLPYTVPDVRVRELNARNGPGGLALSAALATDEGELSTSGTLNLAPWSYEGVVESADARLARHWWDGVTGGTLRGEVSLSQARIRATATVTGGSLEFLNEAVTGIGGSVVYEHPDVRAELTGTVLGGTVAATGGVAIAERRWFADAEGDLELGDAALWLARFAAPGLQSLPVGGAASVQLRAEGWTQVRVQGRALGAGRALGYPLENLGADFTYETGVGPEVAARARLAGGEVRATLEPGAAGLALSVTGDGLALLPGSDAQLRFEGASGAGGFGGAGTLRLGGALLGQPLDAAGEVRVEAGSYRVALAGTALGGALDGGLTLRGEALGGDLRVTGAALPGLPDGADLRLRADGPVSALPLTLELDTQPLGLGLGGVNLELPLSGTLTGTLRGDALDVQGELGALRLTGALSSLATLDGDFGYALAPVALSGLAHQGSASVREGRLSLVEGVLTGTAALQTDAVALPGLRLPALDATASYRLDPRTGALRLTVTDAAQGVALEHETDREPETTLTLTTLTLSDTPVEVSGRELRLSGSASLGPGAGLSGLSADLRAVSDAATLSLSGPASALALRVDAEPWHLSASGTLDLLAREAEASGTLAGYDVSARGTLGDAGPELRARLALGTEALELALAGPPDAPSLSAVGSLPLGPLAERLGLPLTGRVRGDLARGADGYRGQLEFAGDLAGQPVTLSALGRGEELALSGSALPYGLEVALGGALLPSPALTARSTYGSLSLDASGTVQGSGTLPDLNAAGLELSAQAWTLAGDLASGEARLELPGTVLTARRSASGWEVAGTLRQTARRGSAELALDGELSWSQDEPDGRFVGDFELADGSLRAALPVRGNLAELALEGEMSAPLLAALFGLPLDAAGTVSVQGVLRPRDGPSYDLAGDWLAGGQTLALALAGAGARADAALTGPGLELRYADGGVALTADAFSSGPWLRLPVGGTATGSLSRSAAGDWAGALDLAVTDPVPVAATLTGSGAGLDLAASYADQDSALSLEGPLLPALDLALSGAHSAGLGVAGSVRGPLGDPVLEASLTTPAWALPGLEAALPAQQLELKGSLREGLRLGGVDGTRLEGGQLAGTLQVPFTLHGAAHRLSLELSGPPGAPQASGRVSGPYASGPLRLDSGGVSAELSLRPDPWLPGALSAGLADVEASLSLRATPALDWTASLAARGAAWGRDVGLELEATGQGAAYRALGSALVGAERVPISLRGEGATVALSVRPSAFDLAALGLPEAVQGALSGTLALDSSNLDGLSLDLSGPLSLAGTPTTLALRRSGAGPFALSLAGDALELNAALTLADALTLTGTGRYRGGALDLSAALDPSAGAGTWTARLGGATFAGSARREGEGWMISSALDAPEGGALPLAARAEASARFASGRLTLEHLTLSTEAAGLPLGASLSGRAWPDPDLQGSLSGTPLGSFDLRAAASAGGYSVTLAQPDFSLVAALSPALAVQGLSLDANATLPLSGPLSGNLGQLGEGHVWVKGALAWQPETGFAGEAQTAFKTVLETGELRLDASFAGNGALGVRAGLRYEGERLALLEASVAADPVAEAALAGNLTLSAPLEPWWPEGWPLDPSPVTLLGDLALAGSLREPSLSGPMALTGALEAEGELSYGAGRGRLALEGDTLSVTAALSPDGWQLAARPDGLPLGALLDEFPGFTLSAHIEAAGVGGGPVTARARELRLSRGDSSLQGELAYAGGLSGRLRLGLELSDLDLSGLGLSTPLVGRVQGNVTVQRGEVQGANSVPTLSGTLEAQGLGLAGNPALLSGSLLLGGALTRPTLTLRLAGQGSATGALFGSLESAGPRLSLTSTLGVGPLTSDLTVSLEPESFTARGALTLGDLALRVAPETSRERLELLGEGRLAGWRLGVLPGQAEASGPLAALSEQLAGEAALTATWQDGLRLGGGVRGLAASGVALGDLNISSDPDAPARLLVSGEALAGALELPGGRWELTRLELPLPAGVSVAGQGSGTLQEAELELLVRGEALGEVLELPVAASYGGGTLRLRSDSETLGGQATLTASLHPERGWQGEVSLAGAEAFGVRLELLGRLSGPTSTPRLVAETRLTHALGSASGGVTASLDGVTLEQRARLMDNDLAVNGSLWPALDLSLQSGPGRALRLRGAEGELRASGRLALELGPLELTASSPDDTRLALRLAVPEVPGLALAGTVSGNLAEALGQGVTLRGAGDTTGTVRLDLAGRLELSDLAWTSPAGTLTLSGSVAAAGGAQGELRGRWQGSASPAALASFPWLPALRDLELSLSLGPERLTLEGRGPTSVLEARLERGSGRGSLVAALAQRGSRADATLSFVPGVGVTGDLGFDAFPVFSSEASGAATLTGTLQVSPEELSGTASLALAGGSLRAEGRLGLALLPAVLAPQGADGGSLSVRADAFELTSLPWLRRALPYLDAPVSGRLTLEGLRLDGVIDSPELRVSETLLPLAVTLTSAPEGVGRGLSVRGTLAGSPLELSWTPGTIAGLMRFQNFPTEKLVEARLGPSDVTTELSGALRFELPLAEPGAIYLRFASERFRLERAGIVTEGELSFEVRDGGLYLQRAAFEGAGSWRASGEASTQALNLRLEAQQADFSPLLGLIPQLAALEVGAFGSLDLVTTGSLSQPSVRAISPSLRLRVAGSTYELQDAAFTLQDQAFVTSATLEAASPLSGALSLSGGGQITLVPERRFDLSLRFAGDTALPVVGTVQDVQGEVTVEPGEPWRVAGGGRLGRSFALNGTLAPLDVRLVGQRLDLRAPRYALASSETDVDLRLRAENGFVVSGALFVHQARLALARSETAPPPPRPAARVRNPLLERIRFEGVRVEAPQQITLQENFGSAELQADVTLTGTAQAPQLQGSARSLRGTVRFAGRDFTLEEAVAEFEPSRGLYPDLRVRAATSFDKARVRDDFLRVQAGGTERRTVEFVQPAGNTFQVFLGISGEVEADPTGPRPLAFEPVTALSSNAEIQENGSAAPRPLSEPELLSLLTLGRLELSADLISQGGLATTLAQGAVDTAVDFFVLSELQRELGEALGLELFELRTTTLGSLLTGDETRRFGVSLRIGGYLSEAVFASYQIGSLGVAEGVALSNEFNVRYDLYPLELSLAGRLNFFDDATLAPTPEVDLNLSYAVSPLLRFRTGVSLSNRYQGLSFGVNLRW